MKIYTGTGAGEKFEKIKKYDLGVMISPSPTFEPRKNFREISCALDNGAYQAYLKGYPFQEKQFMLTIEKCYSLGIKLDFIVCPDIVAGGKHSLDFSHEWATGKLKTAPNLALVLQDGMTCDDIDNYERDLFTHLFVGGTPDWKWRTLPGWASLAQSYKIPLHVGRVGTLDKLCLCRTLKVSSVDSTNFARNESWAVIENFQQDENLFTHNPLKDKGI